MAAGDPDEKRGGPRLKKRPDDKRGARPGQTTMDGVTGGSIGQAPHVYDPEIARQVREKARLGGDQIDIADDFDISITTLSKYYGREWAHGHRMLIRAIGGKAYEKALKGDNSMIRFVMQTKGGWAKNIALQGAGGGPIQHAVFDFSSFIAGKSEDELAQILPVIDALLAATGNPAAAGGAGGPESADFIGAGGLQDGEDEE